MLKKVAFIFLVCVASFNGKSQSIFCPWNPGVLSFGLGVTNVSIDTGIWSWKNKNPGFQIHSVQKKQFSHLSIPIRMDVPGKYAYANFAIPLDFNAAPQGYTGHLNQSLSFRLGIGICLLKKLIIMPTAQFETSNMHINGPGIDARSSLGNGVDIHYYAYMGTLYSGFGFTSYGSITKDTGFRIGYQKNNIQYADNNGNTERYYAGPRKIWDFALFEKKIPGIKKNCSIALHYNSITQLINAWNMLDNKPG